MMRLYLVPVPIGNLRDITLRAIDTLRKIDFIIAEDTRYSLKLLTHLEIKKKLISYYRPHESRKADAIIDMLRTRDAALITDSGTPLISDPGYILIEKAIENGIEIIPLPGPTAFIPALVASGINPKSFVFMGFPPRKRGELVSGLKSLALCPHTLVFYESPRRAENFLKAAYSVLGNRRFCIGKEISKRYEKMIRGELESLETVLEPEHLLGEIVIIVEGASKETRSPMKPEINSRDDIFAYFKDKYGIPKNSIKNALMKK